MILAINKIDIILIVIIVIITIIVIKSLIKNPNKCGCCSYCNKDKCKKKEDSKNGID